MHKFCEKLEMYIKLFIGCTYIELYRNSAAGNIGIIGIKIWENKRYWNQKF